MTARNLNLSLLLLGAAVVAIGSWAQVAQAADNEGSLDTMWAEHANAGGSTGSTKSQSSSGKESSKSANSKGHVKAICPVTSLVNSGIILTGGWPGVGPFKPIADHPNDFSDSAENTIKLTVDNDEVMAAQLDLTGSSTPKETLLKLQVTTDFLLEGLTVRPAKINEFNLSFEKATSRLKGPLARPLVLHSDPLVVLVKPAESDQTGKKPTYTVVVNAGTGQATKPHTAAQEQPELTAMNTNPTTPAETTTPSESSTPAETSKPSSESNDASRIASASTVQPGARRDELKKQFLQLIQNWQGIKRKAVKDGQTAELQDILAGKALARQVDAIKWLTAHHKYCDIVPKGVSVEQLDETTPDKTYSVRAVVKEVTKYFDQTSGQLLKEINDTYHVIYTVEKMNDRWFITDTTIVKTANPSQTAKGRH